MPLLGQQVATAARRRAWIEGLRHLGEGSQCVLWPWSQKRTGFSAYTRISAGDGTTTSAHRWVWEQLNGPVPEGMEIGHKCDQPGCCRPSHLIAFSHSANIRDSYAKGRMHGNTKNHQVGEAHHSTRLTAEDVYRIRRLAGTKRGAQAELAREFGITRTAVNAIVKRRSWTHLTERD